MDAGSGGIPPSQLALRTDLRAAGRTRGRLLRDERGEPAVRAPRDHGFAYLRMHGPDHHHLYARSYSDADLQWWADRIREWSLAGQDVYVYFNNDGNANAVRNARTLQTLLAPDAAADLRPRLGLLRRGATIPGVRGIVLGNVVVASFLEILLQRHVGDPVSLIALPVDPYRVIERPEKRLLCFPARTLQRSR